MSKVSCDAFLVRGRRLLHNSLECPGVLAAETRTGESIEIHRDLTKAKRGCMYCFPPLLSEEIK